MNLEEIEPARWAGDFASAWDRLLEESGQPSIFLSAAWVSAWWKHFGGGNRPRLLAGWDEAGRLCGVAPLYLRPLRLAGLAGPRVLAMIGEEGVGSEYLGILVRSGVEGEFLNLVAGHRRGDWALLDFPGLREGGVVTDGIPDAFGGGRTGRIHRERHPCSAIPLPRDYESYLASLPQKFRSTVRYRTNKLTKNFRVRLLRTSGPEEIGPHLDRFFAMHQARWVAEGHPGSFYTARKRNFYREVSDEFLRRGWLRFYHLEVDGVIRAAQFGFAFGGVLHSLQEAFDHEFHPRGVGGIGVVLRGMVIRECIGEKLKTYDFLGGEEEFKTRWGTVSHYVHRIRIGAPGAAGAFAFAATAGVRRFKDWGRERLPGWIWKGRDRWRAWRRARRARPMAEETEGAPG